MLLTHGSESLELWQTIVRRVLLQTPTQWRKAEEKEKKRLKDYIGDLWKLFVTSYNASPGSIAETISIAEAVTEASRSWEGVSFAMVLIYEWTAQEMTCHLKYSVQKLEARARYKKPTKCQLQQGEARRGLEAAKGVLPFTGVDHRGGRKRKAGTQGQRGRKQYKRCHLR